MTDQVIHEAQEFTHTAQFESQFKNEDIRYILRHLLDIAEGLTNISSNELPYGLYDFDKDDFIKRLKGTINFIRGAKAGV